MCRFRGSCCCFHLSGIFTNRWCAPDLDCCKFLKFWRHMGCFRCGKFGKCCGGFEKCCGRFGKYCGTFGRCCGKFGKCCGRSPSSDDDEKKEEPGNGHRESINADVLSESVHVPSHNFRLEYTVLTRRGYYPEAPVKENQDSYRIKMNIQGNPNVHFFGVFDGHGQFGTQCSNFVKDRLVEILSSDNTLLEDPVKAFDSAFVLVNDQLHDSEIDDSMSGTTAITVLVIGDNLYVANVGDSRALIAVKDGNQSIAQELSADQTPFRADERERVKQCGARILTVDQIEGNKDPRIQSWGNEEAEGADPPRLWYQNGMYPGTAFTRSVGDLMAEKIGVLANPEVKVVHLTSNHQFFILASDGVFEFLSSQIVVDMVTRYEDPRDACSAIAGESYKLWLEHENRTDDITLIIVHIKGLSSGVIEANGGAVADIIPALLKTEIASPESEIHHSVTSELSDIRNSPTNQSPTVVSQVTRVEHSSE